MNDIEKALKELKIEDLIWLIYLFIVGFALLSNHLERESLLNHDIKAKKEFKTINIGILSVGFFIYLYFLILAYSRLKEINPMTTMKEVVLKNASFVAAALLLIGATIALIVEIESDSDLEEDLLA